MSSPAPSPMTKPERSASKGRLAFCGSPLRVVSAFMALNPETAMAVMVDSTPPVMQALIRPSLMSEKAQPMA